MEPDEAEQFDQLIVVLEQLEDARDVVLQLEEALPRLHPREPLQKLVEFIPDARPHAHPELRLYEDYRRYLLKNPLGTQ